MLRRRLLRSLVFLVSSLLVLCIAGAASAQVGPAGVPLDSCVRRAAPGMSAGHLFGVAGSFDCKTPQRAFGSGDFWVVSQPLVGMKAGELLAVRSSSVWQRSMTLYALYADGTIVTIRTDDRAASLHLRLGAIFQRWLPRRDAPLVRLLWHIEGAANLRGILLAPTLATGGQVARSDTHLAAIYTGIGGACTGLLLFNLGLAYALRHRYMPFYCLMMVSLLVYEFSSSGALAWIAPGIENTARMRINYLLLALVAVSAVAFLRNFFEEGIVTPLLRRVGTAASVAVCGPAVCIVLFAPWGLRFFDTVYSIGFLFLLGSLLPILFNAWRRHSAFLPFFTLAWAVPIAFAVIRVASSLGQFPYSFWIDNSSILSMTIEALLSSLAIGHRVLLLTRERDEAREQEIAARLLADTDPLTGLLNRRSFLRCAIGRDGDFTLLLADLDHFKRVNETIGHDGGDEVLRIFARALRQSVPADALVARLGGEEFAVVLPGEKTRLADDILERLRHARMPFDLTVTASIGCCSGPLTRESDWKALYRSADSALYEAKTAGRDRSRGSPSLHRYAA